MGGSEPGQKLEPELIKMLKCQQNLTKILSMRKLQILLPLAVAVIILTLIIIKSWGFLLLGGEGFSMFSTAKQLISIENGIPQIDLLKKLVEENSPLNPQIDGRMISKTEYVVEDM